MSYWVTKNPNQNCRVPEFRLPESFGSNTVHHFADPKFWLPEPKSPLVQIPNHEHPYFNVWSWLSIKF